jgi:hypothetical protein
MSDDPSLSVAGTGDSTVERVGGPFSVLESDPGKLLHHWISQ